MSKLKFYRIRAGLTQEEVARRLSVNQAAVSNWERGTNPPLQKYRRQLAAIYNVPESELSPQESR